MDSDDVLKIGVAISAVSGVMLLSLLKLHSLIAVLFLFLALYAAYEVVKAMRWHRRLDGGVLAGALAMPVGILIVVSFLLFLGA